MDIKNKIDRLIKSTSNIQNVDQAVLQKQNNVSSSNSPPKTPQR